jgi:polyisoprenoid-binding protein YceI
MTAPRSTGELHDKTLDAAFPAGRWRVLPERSRVGFKVKKMGLYYVKGTFSGVEGTIDRNGRSELMIDAGSLSTRMPPRDWHLRTADFLGVKRHPQIRVSAESVRPAADGAVVTVAEFDLHGTRRPVELRGHLHASPGDDRNGAPRLLLHLEGILDRRDFGVRARPPVEWVVARDVLVDVELALAPVDESRSG